MVPFAMMSSYHLAPTLSETKHSLRDYPVFMQQLLVNRGITDADAASAFLLPQYETTLHDPFLLNDMKPAVERITEAVAANEHIVIYSDYDCDGIPGAVVLYDFFNTVSYTNFSNYIPHRHYEGFGLSTTAVTELKKREAKLIITIDCGTGDHEAVLLANELGIDVIITDHHEPKTTLPMAVAVVNPKVGDSYPFKDLCGAGVVFKLVQALLTTERFSLPPGREKWWLDMVGLATIADMVPLRGENRTLAYYGLMVLRKSRRPGLLHLLQKQRSNPKYLTEDDVGFTIGPRINAASRMDAPEDAFRMLTVTDEGEAASVVAHLEQLNNERKGVVASMTREAHKKLLSTEGDRSVIVVGNPNWRPSLVGLVANKLAEEHKLPAFVWGRDGNGTLKGSCRSGGATSVVVLMEAVADHFMEYGGHHFSGGFSVHDEKIHTLGHALEEARTALAEQAVVDQSVLIDAELSLSDITPDFIKELEQLAPFGCDNPKPLFQFNRVKPTEVVRFGKAKEHTKLVFNNIEAIAFFRLPEEFSTSVTADNEVTLLAHIERSFFMGRLQTRLRIVDIV